MSSEFENSLSESELVHNLFDLLMCNVYSKKCYKCVKSFGRNVGATFSANKLCIYIFRVLNTVLSWSPAVKSLRSSGTPLLYSL
jgi:hypothetical protein